MMAWVKRRKLANRRQSHAATFQLENMRYHLSFSCFEEGQVAEVFLVTGKPGSPLEAACRDMGLLLSIALQYGVPLEEIEQSLTQDDRGTAAGPLGAAIAHIKEMTK